MKELYTVYRKADGKDEELETVNSFDWAVDIIEMHINNDTLLGANAEYRIEKKSAEEKKCHHNICHK